MDVRGSESVGRKWKVVRRREMGEKVVVCILDDLCGECGCVRRRKE